MIVVYTRLAHNQRQQSSSLLSARSLSSPWPPYSLCSLCSLYSLLLFADRASSALQLLELADVAFPAFPSTAEKFHADATCFFGATTAGLACDRLLPFEHPCGQLPPNCAALSISPIAGPDSAAVVITCNTHLHITAGRSSL